jgi:hypothetical protein
VDEARVKALLEQAAERGVGRFELRDTLLLPQGGPAPETREQYVRDLADAIRSAVWEEGMIFRSPVVLPASMDAHRRQLVQECAVPVLQARAGFPAVGRRWVEDSLTLPPLEGVGFLAVPSVTGDSCRDAPRYSDDWTGLSPVVAVDQRFGPDRGQLAHSNRYSGARFI